MGATVTDIEKAVMAERIRCIKTIQALHWGQCIPADHPYNRGLNSGAEQMRALATNTLITLSPSIAGEDWLNEDVSRET